MPVRAREDVDDLADDFQRALVKARRKAGRRVGGQIVRAQRRRLKRIFDGPSQRRLKSVQRVVPRGPTSNGANLTIYDNAPGARIREEGGTIRPQRGQFLAIRTELAFAGNRRSSGRGGGRLSPRDLQQRGETFVIEGSGGTPIVMRPTRNISPQRERLVSRTLGPDASAFPIAVLVRQVRVDAELGLQEQVRRHADDYVTQTEREIDFGT